MTEPSSLWWDTAGAPELTAGELPGAPVDLAVVGAGYTGLAAGLSGARSGARVVVMERDAIGSGASSRNAGMVLPGFKASLGELTRRLGLARARVLFEETGEAITWLESLIRTEQIDCGWRRSGHLTVAAKPSHFADLAEEQRLLSEGFGYTTTLLDRTGLRSELGGEYGAGGLLDPGAAVVQPAALVRGLATAAVRSGVTLIPYCGVRSIIGEPGHFRLETGRGAMSARQVIVATNGYLGRLVPWLARRLVPVGSFIIATEPLPVDVRRRLIPQDRSVSDTWQLLHYFRFSSEGHLIFGGRAGFIPGAVPASDTLLRQSLRRIFPELEGVAISKAWGGTLGFTRDHLPHIGQHEGIGYAMGYGGHGVAMSAWLGSRLSAALLQGAPWPALAEIPFPVIPFYTGRPWFLPLARAYFSMHDYLS